MLSINFAILYSSIYMVPLRVCFLMIASELMTPRAEGVVLCLDVFPLGILSNLGFSFSFIYLFVFLGDRVWRMVWNNS